MPTPSPDSPETAARSLNRWGIGTLAVAQLALLSLCLIAANYLSALYYARADLSRSADYTLSQSTARYLASPALAARGKPVKWIIAIHRSALFYERVRALAEEYARLSGGKIDLEVVDALRAPDRAAQIMAAYELKLAEDLIIIDARNSDQPAVVTNTLGTRELNPHVKLVLAENMTLYETDQRSQRRAVGFQGEDLLTANLVEAIEGKPRTMLLLADKSRINAQGETSPWRTLEDTLRLQNIQLKAVNLSAMTDIPGDVEGVVLVAPKYDLTDTELKTLERYWDRPKSAFLFLLEPGETLSKLKTFLRTNGVTPRADRIVSRKGERLVTRVSGTFSHNIEFIKDLAGQTTEFEGASCSLEVREGANDLLKRKIIPWTLFQASEPFWGETRFGNGQETFDRTEDQAGPLSLAASVVRGNPGSDKAEIEISRMVVIANTDFLKTGNHRAENLDFLASCANWLVGREALAGIGPRSLGTYKMPLLEAQVAFINRINLFFFPAGFVALGLLVWNARRA